MEDTSRISELDIARTSIVSASQASTNEQEWVSNFRVGITQYKVHGHAHRRRPYGIDGDLLLALQTCFFQAGCPEDNLLRLPPVTLLNMSNLSRSSKDYVRMREGLLRLASVRWEMTAQWIEEGKTHQRINASGLISDLWLDERAGLENENGVLVSEDHNIVVVFTKTFADMIRQGLYQILDGELLARLGTPSSRTLYRSLAAHRVQDGATARELSVNLQDWYGALGFHPEARLALRSLNAAHERLIEVGYLDHVEDTGRGSKRTLTYHFHHTAQNEHVEALVQRGVGRAVAATLSADHPEHIYPAIRSVEEKLASGWKPRSLPASLVDAVRNPTKWGYISAPEPVTKPKVVRRKKMETPVEDIPLDPRETVRSLLRVRLGRKPSPAAQARLEQATLEELALLRQLLSNYESNFDLVESVLAVEI